MAVGKSNKEEHMKRKSFLFVVVLILVVSLVPLSGVSAQRTAPTSSASMSAAPAPAARATYAKEIKNKMTMYCGGTVCFRYVQKIYWQYDYSTVSYWAATMKGLLYQTGWYYDGYSVIGTAGGAGKTAYYRWTRGQFYNSTYGYYWLHVAMQVFYNGNYWKDKWYSTVA
jgi:hypothetical protein